VDEAVLELDRLHRARAHVGEGGGGEEEVGVDPRRLGQADEVVDLLVVEVGRVADALHDHPGSLLQGEVDDHPAKGEDGDRGQVGERLAGEAQPDLLGEEVPLGRVPADADHHPLERPGDPLDHVHVAVGDGIGGAGVERGGDGAGRARGGVRGHGGVLRRSNVGRTTNSTMRSPPGPRQGIFGHPTNPGRSERVARASNTQERRQQIVDALLAEMAERGYEGASVQAVARRAGLAPGLVHYHFESKQEILLEAVRQLRDLFARRFEALAARAATPRDRLRAFLDARLARGEGASATAVAAWVVVGAEAVRQPEVKAAFQEVMREQRRMLEQLLRDLAGEALSPRDAGRLCGIVLAAIEGAFQLSVSADEVMPRDYAARTLLAVVESHLAAVGRADR
jgi:TetR/AcrR family transcriptional repressor of bet genes